MMEKAKEYVTRQESDQISRALLSWLNEFPEKPVATINYEFLPADQPGMALSQIQGAYKTKTYLRGAYSAQYQFKVIYRLQPGGSNNTRLSADEMLDRLGDWILWRTNVLGEAPLLGDGKKASKFIINSPSAMFARYEDGSEDHQILMTMEYNSL